VGVRLGEAGSGDLRAALPAPDDRQDEIAAPLRVIAAMTEDEEVVQRLERVVDRQRNGVSMDPEDPLEVLQEGPWRRSSATATGS
jgi:hypothetical protein